jgi:ribulose-phosphate 3-epimerase
MADIKIAPSILSANFSRMGEDIGRLEDSGADMIHCDIMDGNFVPAITFGAKMVSDIRAVTKLPLDVHLMTAKPSERVPEFAKAGADIITFHLEADDNPKRTLELIKSFGIKCGVVINPYTPVESVFEFVGRCDMILLMTVVAGKGGQAFIPETGEKIRRLREEILRKGAKTDIQVDGGITLGNIAEVKQLGANIIVAGSTVFSSEDMKKTIEKLRNL